MTIVQTQVGIFQHNYGKADFDHGVRSGIAFFRRGDWPGVSQTAQQIVEFLKDNIVAPEFPLDDEQVARTLGFLVGWILGEYTIVHGEEQDGRAGVFGPTRLARDMRKVDGEYIGCSDAGTQVIVSARDYERFSEVFRDAKYASWWLQTHSEYVVSLYRPKGK